MKYDNPPDESVLQIGLVCSDFVLIHQDAMVPEVLVNFLGGRRDLVMYVNVMRQEKHVRIQSVLCLRCISDNGFRKCN